MDILRSKGRPEALSGMARYGIKTEQAYGVSIPDLRNIARQTGRDHALAGLLWASGVHDARILAGMIDEPVAVSESQLEEWVVELDSWDLCDQCCMNLIDKTPFAWSKAEEWSRRDGEFVKRAGFVLMARLAVSDKGAADARFYPFLELIGEGAADERNYVKKAVNWALRQIGKRNRALNVRAIEKALEIRKQDSRSARWVAGDALRELTSEAVQVRLSRT